MNKQFVKTLLGRWAPSAVTILVVAVMLFGFRVWAMPGAELGTRSVSPEVISYQGYLTDDTGIPISGDMNMHFLLFDAPIGGTADDALWSEGYIGADAVHFEDGLFNVLLGSLTPIPAEVWSGDSLWLQVVAEPVPGGEWDSLSPRQPITMVPYAIVADRAYGLSATDGDPRDAVIVNERGQVGINRDPSYTLDVNGQTYLDGDALLTGKLGIGTGSPQARIHIPYQGPRQSTVLIGAESDLGVNDFELSIALPAGATHWPFGITKGGTRIAAIDRLGTLIVEGGIAWGEHLVGFDVVQPEAVLDHCGGSPAAVQLIPDDFSICWLSTVATLSQDHSTWRGCTVTREGGYWVLQTYNPGSPHCVHCEAHCLTW